MEFSWISLKKLLIQMDDEVLRQLQIRNRGLVERETQTSTEVAIPGCGCQACGLCRSAHLQILRCQHSFCNRCLVRICSRQVSCGSCSVCPLCLVPLSDSEISQFATDLVRTQDAQAFAGCDIRQCPNSGTGFIFEPGLVALVTVDGAGQAIVGAALECLKRNRLSCPNKNCRVTFCAECSRFSFHAGWTCDEQSWIDRGVVCRCCGGPVPGAEAVSVGERVCEKEGCREL